MQRLVDILTRPLFPAPPGLERLRTRLAVLGFWILLGSLEATKEVVAGALEGTPRSIEQAMLVNFPWWFFWAGGTLVVLWLARRFPFDSSSGTWTWAALVHGIAAAITAAVHLSFVALYIYYTLARGAPITRDTLGEQIRYWMGAVTGKGLSRQAFALVPRMSGLPAYFAFFLSAAFAFPLGLRRFRDVAGRRLGGVGGVLARFCKFGFEFSAYFFKRNDALLHGKDDFDEFEFAEFRKRHFK